MKTILAFALLVSITAAAAQTNQHYTLPIQPSPSTYIGPTNIVIDIGVYYFYASTNATLPFAQWTLFGAAPCSFAVPNSSNYVATTSFGNFITMNPPIYFTMVTSNNAGVSPFSNLAGYVGVMPNGRLTGVTSP